MEIPAAYCAPFHESSNRPHLLFGCEPTLIVLDFLVSLVIGWSFMPKLWGILIAAVVFLFTRQLLRQMAKQDPQLAMVYMEAQRYNQGFWPAKPRRGDKSPLWKRILLGAVTLGFKG